MKDSNSEPLITYDYQMENLGKYMEPLRIAYGLSLQDLANILHVTTQTIWRYERGKTPMSPHMYLAIRGVMYDIADRTDIWTWYHELWKFFIEGWYTDSKRYDPDKIADLIIVHKNRLLYRPKCKMMDIGQEIMRMLYQETDLFI